MFVVSKYVVLEWKYKLIISLSILFIIIIGVSVDIKNNAQFNHNLKAKYDIELDTGQVCNICSTYLDKENVIFKCKNETYVCVVNPVVTASVT